MEIILASSSPRRYEILQAHGITPVVIQPRADEEIPPEMDRSNAEAVVKYLARVKALDVQAQLAGGGAGGKDAKDRLPSLLIAADTIVYCDKIIGKPKDRQDAFRILSSYRNRSHEVWTGVALMDWRTGEDDTFAVRTRVTFGDYSDGEIWRYIEDEQPFDKAGSYAIQSDWGKHVTALEGDFENVIGFPWPAIEEHISKLAGEAV
ncbi:MAG: Maf family protein [Clostridiales Family XIII bacterium]|jgi:septum formation protein|nr:Maf family protein [Clostridiales Family XIII bacterium]